MDDFGTRRIYIEISVDITNNPMMINLTFLVHFQKVYIGRNQDVVERLDQVEEQPDIDHLDVGGLRQVLADADEHRGEDQHHCHVQRNHRLKEELLEVV